ncbi:MAG: TrkH family potassium uptake protein [Candidatus Kapaibacteriales bacterium]
MAIFIGITLLIPIPVSLYYGGEDWSAFLLSALIAMTLGGVAFISSDKRRELRAREGFAVVTFGWLIMTFFGALPYFISDSIPSFTDAFYETMSGFSTTGSTILSDIEVMPEGILFWRSLTHWIGGMGIIVLSIAILPFLGVGGMQLFKAETPGPIADRLTPRITQTAKLLWGVYALFTLAEFILLWIGGMTPFDAVNHAFATMATGGFSTKNASIAHYNSAYIEYVIIFFMFLAGTSFSLHYRWIKGDFKSLFSNREFRFFCIIIALATLLIGADIYYSQDYTLEETFRYGLFQVLAIVTTTGFGTADYELWAVVSQLILFALMFMGGCSGSTSGGMKQIRIFVMIRYVFAEITRLLHPNAIKPVKVGGKSIDNKVIANVAGFFVSVAIIAMLSTIIMSYYTEDISTAFGAVAAHLNNIGPGLGKVGPTDNYGWLPDASKWLLSFLMLVGRLEVYTVVILLAPSYWRE